MIVAKMTIYHDCLYLVNCILGGLWAGWESITCINTSSFLKESNLHVQRELLIVFSTCGLLLTSSFPTVGVMMIIALCVYVCILHVDSSMGMPVQKLQQCPHSTLKGYRDTYWDIFRAIIVLEISNIA